MKRTILAVFAALLATTAVAQQDPPKVIDSRLSVGQNASRTFTTLPPILEAADPTAQLRVFQVRPTTSLTIPFLTFLHRTTAGGADVDRWTMFLDSSLGFNIRDQRQSATRVTIDSAGLMTVPGGVSTTGGVTGGATTATSLGMTGPITFSGANGTGIQGYTTVKALTDAAAAVDLVRLTVPSNGFLGGEIHFTVEATDNTEYQSRSGVEIFSAVSKGATITCAVSTPAASTEAVAVSAGTLANTWSCADNTGGVLAIKYTADTSLTVGAGFLRIRYRVDINNTSTVTPQ